MGLVPDDSHFLTRITGDKCGKSSEWPGLAMSEEYTRRDYAEDKPDSVQATSVSAATNEREVGRTHHFNELYERAGETPGHANDKQAVEGYCGGSRDTREPQDAAEKWASEFEGY